MLVEQYMPNILSCSNEKDLHRSLFHSFFSYWSNLFNWHVRYCFNGNICRLFMVYLIDICYRGIYSPFEMVVQLVDNFTNSWLVFELLFSSCSFCMCLFSMNYWVVSLVVLGKYCFMTKLIIFCALWYRWFQYF